MQIGLGFYSSWGGVQGWATFGWTDLAILWLLSLLLQGGLGISWRGLGLEIYWSWVSAWRSFVEIASGVAQPPVPPPGTSR